VLLGAESRILANPLSFSSDANLDELHLCGPPSLSQAEKLLLSPSTKRSRLSVELPRACVEIDAREIRPGAKIGSGTWSVVHSGEWRGERAALKIFRPAENNAKEQERRWQMFLKEAKLLQEIDSPRVTKLFGVFVGSDGCPCLVTELMEGGTLHELLHGRRKSHKLALEPVDRFLLALHVAEGLSYLHSLSVPVVHRDVKSRNVVIARRQSGSGSPRAAKLIDFGLAEYVGLSDAAAFFSDHGMHGSAVYMAPECFAQPGSLTAKVDVWALGCVLVEVFGGAPPHGECEDFKQVVDKLLKQRVAPDIPAHADLAAGESGDDSIHQLLASCFAFDVAERLSTSGVLEKLQDIAMKRGLEPVDDNDVD